MSDEKTYQLIDDYLSNKLKGSAKDAFKNQLKIDPKLALLVESQELLVEEIRKNRREELKQYLIQNKQNIYFKNMWGEKWTLISAAIFAVFVSAFFIIKNLPYSSTSLSKSPMAKNSDTKVPISSAEDLFADTADTSKLQETNLIATNAPKPMNPELYADQEMERLYEKEQNEISGQSDEAVAAEADFSEQIKKDEKIEERNTPVYAFVMSYQEKANASGESLSKKESREREEVESNDEPSQAREISPSSAPKMVKSISTEYWKSVVNFVGYKFNGNKLQLYGLDPKTTTKITELDGRLYLHYNKSIIYLIPNDDYNKMDKVTNPNLLNALNGQ